MTTARFVFPGIVLVLCSCGKPVTPNTQTAVTATATTATVGRVPPPQFRLDHYKFWKVKPDIGSSVQQQTGLKGQFDSFTRRVIVRSPEYIGNPVEKRRQGYPEQPIQNEKLHYVAYSIGDLIGELEFPPPPIKVTNQFGTGVPWKLRRREWLLVPAAKSFENNPGEPPKADHFLCYAAQGPQVHVAIVLEDQFDKAMHQTEQVRDLVPAYFCVPVRKERPGKPPDEIRDPRTHLAIYDITRPMTVSTKDQFRQQQLTVTESRYLGVPSTKEIVKQ